MRSKAIKLIGDYVCAEKAPFSFSHEDGGEEIRQAAMAYIPNLWEKIEQIAMTTIVYVYEG